MEDRRQRDPANGPWVLLLGPHGIEILQALTGGKCKELLCRVLKSLAMGERL